MQNNTDASTDNKKTANKEKSILSCFSIPFSKCSIVTFVIYLAFIIGALIIVPIIIHSGYPIIKEYFSLSDGYDAAYLTSTILMAVVTVIYVVFTYFIFYATNKNMQQTAATQKIAYLERRLELFYLPMQSALKEIDIMKAIREEIYYTPEQKEEQEMQISGVIRGMFSDFKEEYNKIIRYNYLATNETMNYLRRFISAFESDDAFKHIIEDYNEFKAAHNIAIINMNNFFEYNKATKSAMYKDIESIKGDLAKLVNL